MIWATFNTLPEADSLHAVSLSVDYFEVHALSYIFYNEGCCFLNNIKYLYTYISKNEEIEGNAVSSHLFSQKSNVNQTFQISFFYLYASHLLLI